MSARAGEPSIKSCVKELLFKKIDLDRGPVKMCRMKMEPDFTLEDLCFCLREKKRSFKRHSTALYMTRSSIESLREFLEKVDTRALLSLLLPSVKISIGPEKRYMQKQSGRKFEFLILFNWTFSPQKIHYYKKDIWSLKRNLNRLERRIR